MDERCPECGGEIPAGGAVRLCPQCLLGLGLSVATASVDGASEEVDAPSPASGVLTLPVGALGKGPATITVGAQPEISSETESLLRGRMQVGSWMILFGVLAFVIRDVISPNAVLETLADWWNRFGARVLLILFYAGTIVLLRSSRRLSLRQLRGLEVAILWAVALWFASDRLYYIRRAIEEENAADAVFAISFAVIFYFALMSAYGFFAPNTWRRALRMTSLIALTPLSVLVIIVVSDSGAASFLLSTGNAAIEISSMAMMLGIGVMINTWGAHRIHTLRLEVHEAKRLGQYRLSERIGRGGMGEVWKAEHRLLARPAAIKLIKPEMIDASDPAVAHDFMRSFEREAQTTASLRSVHTVELYDFGITADSAFYYVMELLDGRDLESLVKQFGALEPERVVYLLDQVCDSLAEAHDKGLVHRDIKPANIYVCRMGRQADFVKVLDFGLVKVRSRDGDGRSAGESESVIVGTPLYIAPEMIVGTEVDARADIYSLGCVGYWLLTARPVFEGNTTAEIVAKHVKEAAVAPTQRVEWEIPAMLEQVILACLEKDPAARPQSADELAGELRATGLADAWSQDRARAWWEENNAAG